jgi:hypothetical protein
MSTQQNTDELNDMAPVTVELDAGTAYRDRLMERQTIIHSARKIMMTIYLVITATAIIALTAIGMFAWDTKKTGYLEYPQTCKITKNDVTVNGTRTFGQPFIDFFGAYRHIDKMKTTEKTTIELTGNNVEIVGLKKDGSWWWKNASKGEFGNLPIEHADQYVIMVGGKRTVFTDREFCK